MPKRKPAKTDIRPDVLSAIRKAWPAGVVDMIDPADSYFLEVYPKLKSDLARVKAATLLYEREPEGGPRWNEGSDPDESAPDWHENARSYHLFFLAPAGKAFRFETETEEPDEEDGELRRFSGEGKIGCSVGVSLVAPFAVVAFADMECFENGSRSEPDIEMHIYSLDGEKIEPGDHFRELLDESEMRVLEGLRRKLAGLLESHGIAVLPPQELRKLAPALRGGAETFLEGQPLTVRDAFFFEGL